MKSSKKAFIIDELRDYVMITLAMLSYCIGWTIFLLPNNISTGGVAGVSSILYWGTNIPAQMSYFFINAAAAMAAIITSLFISVFVKVKLFYYRLMLVQGAKLHKNRRMTKPLANILHQFNLSVPSFAWF